MDITLNITVVVAYALTEVSKIFKMVEFYKELNAVHNQIPRGSVCSLIGYFNTQLGNDNGI